MHAIAGLVFFDSRIVDPQLKNQIFNSLIDFPSIKPANIYQCGNSFMGSLALHSDSGEAGPSVDKDLSLALVLDGRIDNKNSLLERLGERKGLSDSDLILRSYRKWGKECASIFMGEYVWVLWDYRSQSVLCSRDPMGQKVLYTAGKRGEWFAFASSIKPLLKVPGFKKELNRNKIYEHLCAFKTRIHETAYAGIDKVVPGTLLMVCRRGRKEIDTRPKSKHNRKSICTETLKHLFEVAVSRRFGIMEKTACHISYGSDSSLLALVAAKQYEKTGKSLQAFYSGNSNKHNTSLKAKFESLAPGLSINTIEERNQTLFEGLSKFYEWSDGPIRNPFNRLWIEDVIRAAKARGFYNILTGASGNLTTSFRGSGIVGSAIDILRSLKIVASAKICRNSPWLKHAAANPVFWETGDSIKSYLGSQKQVFEDPRHFYFRLSGYNQAAGALGAFRSIYGIEHSDPFADQELVSYVLEHSPIKFRSGRLSKWPFYRSFGSMLPEDHFKRSAPKSQGTKWEIQFESSKHLINDYLEEFAQSAKIRSIVDIKRLGLLLLQFGNRNLSDMEREKYFRICFARAFSVAIYMRWFERGEF